MQRVADRDTPVMVVDLDGKTVTAREHRRLLHVTATPRRGGGIELSAPGLEPVYDDGRFGLYVLPSQ